MVSCMERLLSLPFVSFDSCRPCVRWRWCVAPKNASCILRVNTYMFSTQEECTSWRMSDVSISDSHSEKKGIYQVDYQKLLLIRNSSIPNSFSQWLNLQCNIHWRTTFSILFIALILSVYGWYPLDILNFIPHNRHSSCQNLEITRESLSLTTDQGIACNLPTLVQ